MLSEKKSLSSLTGVKCLICASCVGCRHFASTKHMLCALKPFTPSVHGLRPQMFKNSRQIPFPRAIMLPSSLQMALVFLLPSPTVSDLDSECRLKLQNWLSVASQNSVSWGSGWDYVLRGVQLERHQRHVQAGNTRAAEHETCSCFEVLVAILVLSTPELVTDT